MSWCAAVFVQVEPPVARLLELDRLPSNVSYTPSRNRQWHMYNCSERKDSRAPMLCRTFLRGLVRQMGSPAVLAATYSNNTEQMASAAVNELQEALVSASRLVLSCHARLHFLWGLSK
jgi:acetyl-CoA carboxylase/biotin carboxylase 1